MYLISRKVKVLIPGLIIALTHIPSIYNKSFCTFLKALLFSEYFSYAVFHLIFTTSLGKWEKHYYSTEIKRNRLGNCQGSAQRGSKNHPQLFTGGMMTRLRVKSNKRSVKSRGNILMNKVDVT